MSPVPFSEALLPISTPFECVLVNKRPILISVPYRNMRPYYVGAPIQISAPYYNNYNLICFIYNALRVH